MVQRPQIRGRMPAASSLDLDAGPLIVFYEVTQACDLACQHCRACAQPLADPAELTPAQSRSLIEQLTEFAVPPMLVLTGGDPLKRSDIFSLVRHAVQAGLDVSITPSATPLVTRDAINRLADEGVSRLAISIDGADPTTHDAMRRVEGSFRRSLEILRDAQAAGLETQVNTTLSPHNANQIERLAELCEDLGVCMWSVFYLVPVGRAQELPRLSADECERAFARLWRESRRRPFAIKTTEAPHYRRYVAQHRVARGAMVGPRGYASANLNDGRGVMFVSHTGIIHPSGFLPMVCGVFPQDHVVRIYRDSPVFRALRDPSRLQGKCHDCEFRKVCGGSRARAYAVTGNLLAEEPDCNYQPRATAT
ncbi:MAG: radical SAM protein [Planctomycetales bacterium]|nr:radical SAM protein [Planctomycetales bacterium]